MCSRLGLVWFQEVLWEIFRLDLFHLKQLQRWHFLGPHKWQVLFLELNGLGSEIPGLVHGSTLNPGGAQTGPMPGDPPPAVDLRNVSGFWNCAPRFISSQ